jgi:hypothetical protein
MIFETVDNVRRGDLRSWSADALPQFVTELQGTLADIPVSLHPLGFIHFELTEFLGVEDDTRIRVHLWNPLLSPPDSAGGVHDHTWHLKSGVLYGKVLNKNFRPVRDPAGPLTGSLVTYGATNSFTAAGRYRLESAGEVTVAAGETYSIPSRIVHESALLSPQALTLVISQPDEQAHEIGPLLLSASATPPSGTERRELLSAVRAEQILIDFIKSAI